MTPPSAILTDVRDHVLTVTLNRPEKLNALTPAMIEELLAALREGEADPAVRVILVRGAGRSFCSGMDLAALVAADNRDSPERSVQDDAIGPRTMALRWRQIFDLRKPVTVAVQGYCLGSPLEIVLHADIAIAADDARFGYPPVRATGMPDTQMLVYQVGPQWTKRLLMTGDQVDAATARDIGLVCEVVPRAELEARAFALARSMCQVPGPLLEAVKRVTNAAVEMMGYSALQRVNWAEMAMARSAPEMLEFTRIFRERGMEAAIAWRDGGKAPTTGPA